MDDEAIGRLSARQRDCLRLVAELKKTEQIAHELGISPSTVSSHLERAMTIMGVSSRREAALAFAAFENRTREKSPTAFQRLSEPVITAALSADPPTAARRRRNDLTPTQRLAIAVAGLTLLCIAIAGLGAAIGQLSDWRASLAVQPSTRSH